jgi:hypothetical protein
VNRRKPHVQTLVVSRYPAPAPIDDFFLLFLPPCGPHLTLLSTGSLESGLLASPLLEGYARHRPFAPTLHLDQRKSRRNLHLQYLAKSQSMLSITHHNQKRPSTGPRTLRSSISPSISALTTHISNQFREEKMKRNERKTQASDQKPNKSQEKII